jgi:hypothetical protein
VVLVPGTIHECVLWMKFRAIGRALEVRYSISNTIRTNFDLNFGAIHYDFTFVLYFTLFSPNDSDYEAWNYAVRAMTTDGACRIG